MALNAHLSIKIVFLVEEEDYKKGQSNLDSHAILFVANNVGLYLALRGLLMLLHSHLKLMNPNQF